MAERFDYKVEKKNRVLLPPGYSLPQTAYTLEMKQWCLTSEGERTKYPFLHLGESGDMDLRVESVDALTAFISHRKRCDVHPDGHGRILLKAYEIEHMQIDMEKDRGVFLFAYDEGDIEIWSPKVYLSFDENLENRIAPEVEKMVEEFIEKEAKKRAREIMKGSRLKK